jgi:membrane protein YdbS with pleckstrin-like domain
MYAKPRLPDPVRKAAVRALVIVAVTLVQLMIAVLCSLAAVWLAFPMVISTVVSTVVATWAVLDVWVTRQVWRQRHGVVSLPSSAARARPRVVRRAKHEGESGEQGE